MKALFAALLALSAVPSFASAPKSFDRDSLDLAKATLECAKEYTTAMSEIGGPNAGLLSASLVEGGHHEFDQTFTLKMGYAHPMVGVVKTKQIIVERRFVPIQCPKGAMDCGGGSYETTCKKSDIDERE
jgi:hypothetical protein